MDLPKYLITGAAYKICDNYPAGEGLPPEEYCSKYPEKWNLFYSQKLTQLNSVGNSGNFEVSSLEVFPFNYKSFFKDNGYSLIDVASFTGGCDYTIVKNKVEDVPNKQLGRISNDVEQFTKSLESHNIRICGF